MHVGVGRIIVVHLRVSGVYTKQLISYLDMQPVRSRLSTGSSKN